MDGVVDAYVHPLTGCQYADHFDWAFWLGFRWPLNDAGFSCDYPGCSRGAISRGRSSHSEGATLMKYNVYEATLMKYTKRCLNESDGPWLGAMECTNVKAPRCLSLYNGTSSSADPAGLKSDDEAAASDMELILLPEAAASAAGARCIDSSAAGYYLARGAGAGQPRAAEPFADATQHIVLSVVLSGRPGIVQGLL
jgi:hypothetical protein